MAKHYAGYFIISSSSSSASTNPSFLSTVFVGLIPFILYLPLLGIGEVFQVSEGREGVVVREILRTGEYVLPLRHGSLVPSKPPLFHWFSALLAQLIGNYDEFVLRLPSVFGASLCAVAMYRAGFAVAGRTAALLSVFVLVSTYGFVRLATDGRVDMLFTGLSTAAICIWLSAWARLKGPASSQPVRIGFGSCLLITLCLGLAILCKGPLGAVYPILIIAAVLIAFHGVRAIFALLRPELLLAPLLALPWYVLAYQKASGAFVGRQIVFENITRFIGGEGISEKPWWFYLANMWDFSAPWLIFLIIFWLVEWRRGGQRVPDDNHPSSAIIRIGMIWFLISLFFFSLSVGKRSAYLLMALPGLALACGGIIETLISNWLQKSEGRTVTQTRFGKIFLICWSSVAFVTVAAAVYLRYGAFTALPVSRTADVLQGLVAVAGEFGALIAAVGVLLFLGTLLCFLTGFRRRSAILIGAGLSLFVLTMTSYIVTVGFAGKGKTHGYKMFATEVLAKVPSDVPIVVVKTARDESLDALLFYVAERETALVDPNDEHLPVGTYLMRRSWIDAHKEVLQGRMTELGSYSRGKDKPEDAVVLAQLQPAAGLP